MSNTRTISEYKPAGDMGIGLCLLCIAEAKATEPASRKPPAFAIALVPHLQMLPDGASGLVTAGACWDHIGGGDQQQQRRPLLVAQGSVPR